MRRLAHFFQASGWRVIASASRVRFWHLHRHRERLRRFLQTRFLLFVGIWTSSRLRGDRRIIPNLSPNQNRKRFSVVSWLTEIHYPRWDTHGPSCSLEGPMTLFGASGLRTEGNVVELPAVILCITSQGQMKLIPGPLLQACYIRGHPYPPGSKRSAMPLWDIHTFWNKLYFVWIVGVAKYVISVLKLSSIPHSVHSYVGCALVWNWDRSNIETCGCNISASDYALWERNVLIFHNFVSTPVCFDQYWRYYGQYIR